MSIFLNKDEFYFRYLWPKLVVVFGKVPQREANGSVIEKKYATKGANVKKTAGSEEFL